MKYIFIIGAMVFCFACSKQEASKKDTVVKNIGQKYVIDTTNSLPATGCSNKYIVARIDEIHHLVIEAPFDYIPLDECIHLNTNEIKKNIKFTMYIYKRKGFHSTICSDIYVIHEEKPEIAYSQNFSSINAKAIRKNERLLICLEINDLKFPSLGMSYKKIAIKDVVVSGEPG